MKTVVIKVESLKGDHAIAEQNPLMSEVQFKALKLSIQEIGQREPILTFRGFVVDGRNRVRALKLLGIEDVIVRPLPQITTKEELMTIAMGTEARRHQTKTQLAVKAFLKTLGTRVTQLEAATEVGVAKRTVEYIAAIYKLAPATVTDLQMGGMYILESGARTDNPSAILKDLKSRHAKAVQFEELESKGIANLTPEEKAHMMQVQAAYNMLTSIDSNVIQEAIRKYMKNN